MPLTGREIQKVQDFIVPLSYRAGEYRSRLRSCLNVFPDQNRLDTRYGISRYNATAVPSGIKSISFFKDASETRFVIAKAGTKIYTVPTTGSSTAIKTGLTSSIKHRGVTLDNRHIIAVGSDGLFQYNGSVFTVLGVIIPDTPTQAVSAGGNLTASNNYRVGVTFYCSGNGFESNAVYTPVIATDSTDKTIDLTNLDTTSENANVDKKRIYLRDDTADGLYLFIAEIDLATTTHSITANSDDPGVPPEKHAPPVSGGGKYLVKFGDELAYAGSSTAGFENDVFLSEPNNHDGFDNTATARTLFATGDGPVTGLGVGLFNESRLDPFLVVFKRNITYVYSVINGQKRFATADDKHGCVSHDTIITKDGVVYYMSAMGWRGIRNGLSIKDPLTNMAMTLGDGDIDDIFRNAGYSFELNRANFANCYSTFFGNLDQYITFVNEGSSVKFSRAYVYSFDTHGFYLYEFKIESDAISSAEDADGEDIILLGSSDGFLYKHSVSETRNDVDTSNVKATYEAHAQLIWTDGNDFSRSYNFRDLVLRALAKTQDITVKYFINYTVQNAKTFDLSHDGVGGFQLDVDKLDLGILGDARQIVSAVGDLNVTGENILVGFYLEGDDVNIGLVSAQMDFSKNGNRNC